MNQRAHEWRHDLLAAAAASAALAVPGILAVASGKLLLFASLGPTAALQAHSHHQAAARQYNLLIGHAAGLLSAVAVVHLLGLASAPSVFDAGGVSVSRLLAALLSLAVATFVELRLDARHPPAAATALLVALGSFRPSLHDIGLIVAGVAALALGGEVVRRLMNDLRP